MKTETRKVETLDLSLGAGRRTLRVALTRGEDGTPEQLILSAGFGGADSGQPFARPGWESLPLTVPAEIIPKLRAALELLVDRGGKP